MSTSAGQESKPTAAPTRRTRCCALPSATRVESQVAVEYAEVFRALADPTRIEILGILAQCSGELCVCEIERQFTHTSFPFIHNLVYGLGKPLLESGLLPEEMANAADRTSFDQNTGSWLNPINLGIAVLNWFDRSNKLDEPPHKSTVNLAIKGRKPA